MSSQGLLSSRWKVVSFLIVPHHFMLTKKRQPTSNVSEDLLMTTRRKTTAVCFLANQRINNESSKTTMKKILLTLVGLSALMSIHAQVVEIYKNGQWVQTYYNTPNSQYEVVFKSSGDQEKINGHEYIEIAGRKWATMNVGATTVAESPETAYGDYYTWGETDTYYSSLTETGIKFKSNATGTHIKGKKTGYNYGAGGILRG